MDEIVLEYIGGGDYVTGIPARDLHESDFDAEGKCYGYTVADLIGLGLYSEPKSL